MSVQKITNLSKQNIKKSASKKSTQSNMSDVKSERNDVFLEKSEALKSNFLSGISFKGYTKTIKKDGYYVREGTSGRYYHASISQSDIEYNKELQQVVEGKRGYNVDSDKYVEASVYYADLDEEITEDIENNHKYIVKAKDPKEITYEEIEDANRISELKEIITELESSTKILQSKIRKATMELDEANKTLDEATSRYEKALSTQKEKSARKEELDSKAFDVQEKTTKAKAKQKMLQEKEEEQIRIASQIRQFKEIKKQLLELGMEENSPAIEDINLKIRTLNDNLQK